MKLTVTTAADEVIPLEIPEEMELENFLALCQVEAPSLSQTSSQDLLIIHNGSPLIFDTKSSLRDARLRDGDMVVVTKKPLGGTAHNSASSQSAHPELAQLDLSLIRVPGSSGSYGSPSGPFPQPPAQFTPEQMLQNPEAVREMLLRNPGVLATIRERNPPLAEALESNDLGRFKEVLGEQVRHQMELDRMRIRAFNDPFDVEAQTFIENEIHKANIESILEAAIEHTPESFATVCMLYIQCKVNGHPIKAFVDSGAQTTIMSSSCAERCSITRLVDKRFTGIAKGVGTQKIVGRIHMAQLQIEGDFLPTSFTVLEDQTMDMLLGLDMLKRHQCIMDLKRGVLVIGTTGTETRFLPESELPHHSRMTGGWDVGDAEMTEDGQLAAALNASAQEAQKSQSDGINTSSSASAAISALPPGVSEETVRELVEMGFDRGSATVELAKARGNKTTAVAALLAKSIKAPPKISDK